MLLKTFPRTCPNGSKLWLFFAITNKQTSIIGTKNTPIICKPFKSTATNNIDIKIILNIIIKQMTLLSNNKHTTLFAPESIATRTIKQLNIENKLNNFLYNLTSLLSILNALLFKFADNIKNKKKNTAQQIATKIGDSPLK